MPRIPRGQTAGYAYHVRNRGNAQTQIFHKAEDYTACVKLLAGSNGSDPCPVNGQADWSMAVDVPLAN